MQGKTRSFFEDTIILVLVAGLAYGAYKAYDIYYNEDLTSLDTQKIVQEDNNITSDKEEKNLIDVVISYFKESAELLQKETLLDLNTTQNSLDQNETKIVDETLVQDTNNTKLPTVKQKELKTEETVKENEKIEEKQIIKKELENNQKKEQSQIEKNDEIEVEEKSVDLTVLREFIRNLKFKIASSLVKRVDVNTSQTQELQLRITVLKDGNFEELTFVSGDQVLFDMNKENIQNVFPVTIDKKIEDNFPRYVRLSIK